MTSQTVKCKSHAGKADLDIFTLTPAFFLTTYAAPPCVPDNLTRADSVHPTDHEPEGRSKDITK